MADDAVVADVDVAAEDEGLGRVVEAPMVPDALPFVEAPVRPVEPPAVDEPLGVDEPAAPTPDRPAGLGPVDDDRTTRRGDGLGRAPRFLNTLRNPNHISSNHPMKRSITVAV